MRSQPFLGLVAALAITVASGEAAAQSLALDRFEPAPAGDRMFGVQSPSTYGHLTPYAMLLAEYAHNPFVLRQLPSERATSAIVGSQLFGHINGGITLYDRLLINLDIPVAFVQSGDRGGGSAGPESPGAADFGDVRAGLRVRLWGDPFDALQIAVAGYVFLPTGHRQGGGATPTMSYVTDGTVRGLPQLVVGGRVSDRFLWAANMGPEFQQSQSLTYGQPLKQGPMFRWGAGVGYLLLDDQRLQLGLESSGAVTVDDIQTHTTNLELLAGARYRFEDNLEVGAAAGPGLAGGIGTPDARAVFSVAYAPQAKRSLDRDNDRIPDKFDACPDTPGVPDPDPTRNGCPPSRLADRDGDGILDMDDACPDVKGVRTSDPKTNGCPPDRDHDTVLDPDDACPDVKGVPTKDPKTNGCPPDSDGDGIPDATDACPDVKGVPTRDPKTNGCPPDTDGDGITDDKDACPNEKGLPDPDPTKNGCPRSVRVTEDEIVILEQVQFDTGKATIKPASNPLLAEVVGVLKEHPEILRLEVQGHTDNRGTKWLNQKLSQERAQAVANALIQRGVDRGRIAAKGYGRDRPIAPNVTDATRQKNRRVQFKILEKGQTSQKK